jgi:hypothetical protein
MKSRIAVVFRVHRDFSDFGVLNTLGHLPRDCAKRLLSSLVFSYRKGTSGQYLMGFDLGGKKADVCS